MTLPDSASRDPLRLGDAAHLAPPPRLAANIRAAVAAEPARALPIRTRFALAAIAVPLAVALVPLGRAAVFGTPPIRCDVGELSTGAFVARLGMVLAIALVATGVALYPGRRGFGTSAALLLLAAVIVAPVYAAVTAARPLLSLATISAALRLHPLGLPCFVVALLVGTATLAAFARALRGAVPVTPGLRGAALGAAAGAWAGAALFVHCPAHDLQHLLVGHALPVAAFAIVGALVTPRILRP